MKSENKREAEVKTEIKTEEEFDRRQDDARRRRQDRDRGRHAVSTFANYLHAKEPGYSYNEGNVHGQRQYLP